MSLNVVLLDKVSAILRSRNAAAIGALTAEVNLVYEYVAGEARETDQCSGLPRQ